MYVHVHINHLNLSLFLRVECQWVASCGQGLSHNGLWPRETSTTQTSLQWPVHSTGVHLESQRNPQFIYIY